VSVPPLTAADLRRRWPTLQWFASLLWFGLLLLYTIPESSSDGDLGDVLGALYFGLYLTTVLVQPVLRRVGYALSLATGLATAAVVADIPPGIGRAQSLAALAIVLVAVTLLFVVQAERERSVEVLQAWSGPVPAPTGGLGYLVSGSLVAALAGLCLALSVGIGLHEKHRESSARVEEGTVIAIPDDSTLTVRVGDTVHDVDISDTSDWEVGELDDFWVDEHGAFRSTEEPFSMVPGVVASAPLLMLGGALVLRGRQSRRTPDRYPVRLARAAPWGPGMLLLPVEPAVHYGAPLVQVSRVEPHPSPVREDWPRDEGAELAVVYGIPRSGRPVLVRTRDTLLVGRRG
jgi:hypothetical protein